MCKLLIATVLASTAATVSMAQDTTASMAQDWHVVREHAQHSFALTVPRGNYSGITHLHDDIYAVVSDKSDSALYFNFRIQVDPVTGELKRVENLGYVERVDGSRHEISKADGRQADGRQADGSRHEEKAWRGSETGFDHEAITKVSDSTLVVASEGKCRLKEYPIVPTVDRKGWQDVWSADQFYPNYNFESLAYDSVRHYLWTIPESVLRKDGSPATPENQQANKLRLIRYSWPQTAGENRAGSESQTERTEYAYLMDRPSTSKKAETYVMGVSELCALPDDGQLLVLEREAFIPKIKLGAFCRCKLYLVNPLQEQPIDALQPIADSAPFVKKRLLAEWRTNLSIFDFSFANYEGMCLGPKLSDGSQVLILLSDSQDQYAGILRDYFKTIVIAKQ